MCQKMRDMLADDKNIESFLKMFARIVPCIEKLDTRTKNLKYYCFASRTRYLNEIIVHITNAPILLSFNFHQRYFVQQGYDKIKI